MTTHPQNLEIVRRACIEANPEIMELKFGCKVQTTFDGRIQTDLVSGYVVSQDFAVLDQTHPKGRHAEVRMELIENNNKGFFEILGRPIRLADIILAIGLNRDGWPDVVCMWDCIHDDLSLQSEETILFLANILR